MNKLFIGFWALRMLQVRTNTNIKKIISKTQGILAEYLATLLWKVMCKEENGSEQRTRCYNYVLCLVAQSCLILGDPMNEFMATPCSPPGSSVHGILQATTLEWITISFSRGIFLTQGLNLHCLLCSWILYH